MAGVEVRRLEARDAHASVNALAEVLRDCVAGGASVGFMADLTHAEARTFFEQVVSAVEENRRLLFAAFDDDVLVGTVQVVFAQLPNQPHRADVSKLLVLRSARNRGIGRLLMERAEADALAVGRTLLVLDTATGAAERLYERLGWTAAGVVPGYALDPSGALCCTTFYWKQLG